MTSTAGTSARTAAAAIVADAIELSGTDGRSLRIGIRTELGKGLLRQFGPDAEFWDNRQCVIERNSAREWILSPNPAATNETLVNGEALTRPRGLRQGDRISVGRQAKGIAKLPLTVRGL
jgi:hypothetical protein